MPTPVARMWRLILCTPKVVYAALWESRLGPWEDDNQYDNGTKGGLFEFN